MRIQIRIRIQFAGPDPDGQKSVKKPPKKVLRIRIRDPVHFLQLEPIRPWVKKNKFRIRDEHPGSYFRELRNNFWD